MIIVFLQFKCISDGSQAFYNRYDGKINMKYEYVASTTAEETQFCGNLLGHEFKLILQVGADTYEAEDFSTFQNADELTTSCAAASCSDFSAVRLLTYKFEFRDLNVSIDGTVGYYSLKEYDYRECWSSAVCYYDFTSGSASVALILQPLYCQHRTFSAPPTMVLYVDYTPVFNFPLTTTGNVFYDNANVRYNCNGDEKCILMLKQWIQRPFFNAQLILAFPFVSVFNGYNAEFVYYFTQIITETHGYLGDDCVSDISVEFYQESFHVGYSKGEQQHCSLHRVEQMFGPIDHIEMRVLCSELADYSGFRFYESVNMEAAEFADTEMLIKCYDQANTEQCLNNIAYVSQLADNYTLALTFLFVANGEAVERVEYPITTAKQCNLGISVAVYPEYIECVYTLRYNCVSSQARFLQLKIVFRNGDTRTFVYEGPHADTYRFAFDKHFKRYFGYGKEFDHVTLIDSELETTSYQIQIKFDAEPFYYGFAVCGGALLCVAVYLLILRKSETL